MKRFNSLPERLRTTDLGSDLKPLNIMVIQLLLDVSVCYAAYVYYIPT